MTVTPELDTQFREAAIREGREPNASVAAISAS